MESGAAGDRVRCASCSFMWRCEGRLETIKWSEPFAKVQASASARKTRWTGSLEQGAQQMPPLLTFEPDRNPHLLLPRRSVHTSVVRAASPYPSYARAHTQLTRRDTFAPPCAQACSTARSRRASSTLDLFWVGRDLVPAAGSQIVQKWRHVRARSSVGRTSQRPPPVVKLCA